MSARLSEPRRPHPVAGRPTREHVSTCRHLWTASPETFPVRGGVRHRGRWPAVKGEGPLAWWWGVARGSMPTSRHRPSGVGGDRNGRGVD
jgi:hypothetical protein